MKAPTRLLVLGSPHLGGSSDAVRMEPLAISEAAFRPLLAALAPHAKDGVMVEADAPESGAGAHGREAALSRYPWLSAAWRAGEALGLGFPEARQKFLAGEGEGLELALLALAAYEPHSALLWGLRAGGAERAKAPLEVRDLLERGTRSRSEAVRIGVRLAEALGHRRIFAIDDGIFGDLPPGVKEGDLGSHPEVTRLLARYREDLAALRERLFAAAKAGDLRPVYREENGQERLELLMEQWRVLLRVGARPRLAMWEARNLVWRGISGRRRRPPPAGASSSSWARATSPFWRPIWGRLWTSSSFPWRRRSPSPFAPPGPSRGAY